MVLAVSVLIFHLPAATALRNARTGPISLAEAKSEAELARNGIRRIRALTIAQPPNGLTPAVRSSTAAIAAPKLHPDDSALALGAEMAARAGSAPDTDAKPPTSRHTTVRIPAAPVAAVPTKKPAPAQPSSAPPKNENASAGQPFAPADGYAPATEPIIHSFLLSTGSIAQLTGPSFSDVILPPPAFRPPYELPATNRRVWLFLSSAEHGAATYDAWSTRRALAAGRIEADPLMRPFAGSSALYPAIQLVPLGLDYLSRRLQRSSGWAHRIWWLPQSAATVTFLFSGSYNVAHTN